jgi:hypothetical protein
LAMTGEGLPAPRLAGERVGFPEAATMVGTGGRWPPDDYGDDARADRGGTLPRRRLDDAHPKRGAKLGSTCTY